MGLERIFFRGAAALSVFLVASSCTEKPETYSTFVASIDACDQSDAITCSASNPSIMNAGQSSAFTFDVKNSDVGQLVFLLSGATSPAVQSDLGSIATLASNQLTYTAPATVTSQFDVLLTAVSTDHVSCGVCKVRLKDPAAIGVGYSPDTQAVVGTVYEIPAYSGPGGADTATNPNYIYVPPDFSTLTPILKINVPNINIPLTNYSAGFPGYPQLIEWFGIRFEATLTVPVTGKYVFQTESDDGSRLYVDGNLLVDNTGADGNSPTGNWHQGFTPKSSPATNLTAGAHYLRVDWIQGPRYQLGLVLSWLIPGASSMVVVPATVFTPPAQ